MSERDREKKNEQFGCHQHLSHFFLTIKPKQKYVNYVRTIWCQSRQLINYWIDKADGAAVIH